MTAFNVTLTHHKIIYAHVFYKQGKVHWQLKMLISNIWTKILIYIANPVAISREHGL